MKILINLYIVAVCSLMNHVSADEIKHSSLKSGDMFVLSIKLSDTNPITTSFLNGVSKKDIYCSWLTPFSESLEEMEWETIEIVE